MSAVKGVNKTLIDAGGESKILQGFVDARVKAMVDTYEASALASNSTISVGGTLPDGAKIINVILGFDALSTVTVDVGDSADADRYIAAKSASSAGVGMIDQVNGVAYVVGTASGDNQVVLHTSGASAATGTINVCILYTLD